MSSSPVSASGPRKRPVASQVVAVESDESLEQAQAELDIPDPDRETAAAWLVSQVFKDPKLAPPPCAPPTGGKVES